MPVFFRNLGLFVLLVCVTFCADRTMAKDSWGSAMFAVKKHDFGRVAIGADAVYHFELQNIYKEDIKLLSVQSSCGCTEASLSTKLLKSEEKGSVIAKLNTTGQHTREKAATLTLNLETVIGGRTVRDTVQLSVTSYIRPDVVLTPGGVEFGSVASGQTVVRTVQMEYAGRPDWALTKIERSNPYVHAKAVEVKRNGGEIAYKITVTLKPNATVGYVKDALRFKTNELKPGLSEAVEIVLPIQGVVMAPIHAKPSPFMVGVLSPGERVLKNLVVRSDTPFKILEVTSEDKRFRFTFSNQESAIQIVSALFSAKDWNAAKPENVADTIRIRTNLPNQEFVTLDALALLTPKEFLNKNIEKSHPEEVPPEKNASKIKPFAAPKAVAVEPTSETVTKTDVSEDDIQTVGAGGIRFGKPKVRR